MIREKKTTIINIYSFSKLSKFKNYIQWNRQMFHEIRSIELYDFIDEKNSWNSSMSYIEIEFVKLIKKEKENHLTNVKKYHDKIVNLTNKINKMCKQHI